ncbi:HET-domain-containing protein [Xylaria sp. FL1777]|nr:HET-domain-containing protein [Xylaria sp. FL1777]
MASVYNYEPLYDSRNIRVLDLLPSSFDDPVIHCRMRHITLGSSGSKTEPFDAISYTWGNYNPRRGIHCNERNDQLQVSHNCYNVLRYLRCKDKPRTVWIDAICINQSDIAEKTCQVKIMGEIYATASTTFVFLGEPTQTSQTLFQHLDQIHQQAGHSTASSPHLTADIVHATEDLFRLPWFSRSWVVQELVRSPHPIFMCGHDTVTFEALSHFLYRGDQNMRFLRKFPVPIELKDEHFQSPLEMCSTAAQQLFLLEVGTGLCQSTVPHDRVLSLTPLVTIGLSTLESLIDYEQSVEELFYKFALLALSDGVGLALLSMIRGPHSNAGLPSWVPDLTNNANRSRLIPHYPVFFEDHFEFEFIQYFRVQSHDEVHDLASNQLILNGRRYGRIAEQGPVILINQTNAPSKIASVNDLVTLLDTIRCGVDGNIQGWPASIRQAIRGMSKTDISTFLRSGIEHELHSTTIDEPISYNVAVGCHETRVFITSEGNLGLCPEAAQKNDLVCLIKGAIEPCVLREKGNGQWILVTGDCLLLEIEHGYAKGNGVGVWEYIDNLLYGSLEEFRIC